MCVDESGAGAEVGDYDETSIRYTGRNIPSRSFRMLQHLTGGADEDNSIPPQPGAISRDHALSHVCIRAAAAAALMAAAAGS